MPPKKLPKVSGKPKDYRKKKSKTTTSPYKFNEPKIKGAPQGNEPNRTQYQTPTHASST